MIPRHPRFLLIVALPAVGLLTDALSEDAAPKKKTPPPPEALEWMEDITRGEPGTHRDLAPVRIDYGLSWNNALNAGEFSVTLNRSEEEPDSTLVGLAEGRSNGLARALWPYEVAAESLVDRRTLRPRLFEVVETERGKSYEYHLEFSPTRVMTRTTTLPKAGKETAEPVVSEKAYRYDFIHDVLSAVLYIRSQDLADGDVIKSVVSPFNRPYYTEFSVLEREKHKIKGDKFDAIRLGVEIRKINADRTLQTYEKMKKATIWLSDDEFRLPLEVQADIFVGYISARMTGRKWLENTKEPKAETPAAKDNRKGMLGTLGGKGTEGE